MLAAKDSKPATSGERETTASENEKSSTTSTPQPSGLGELAAPSTAPSKSVLGCIPSRGRLLWRRLRCGDPKQGLPRMYGLIPGCGGHMVAFYGRKGHPKAGLLQEQGIQASQAIATIPTWMGYPATWRTRCVSVAEANEIVTAVKDWKGRTGGELVGSFNKGSPPCDWVPHSPPSPNCGYQNPDTSGIPNSSPSSDEGETSPDTSTPDRTSRRRRARRGNRSRYSDSDSEDSHASAMRRKKKDGFSNKIQIPEFGGKKGHPHDVASAFRQWARCITYYRDYYEDSYLMPLVVSSLTGDASDVFDWTRSLTPGDPRTSPLCCRC